MYIPAAFAITAPGLIHGFLAENNFGVLMTALPGAAPVATHLPFVFDWSQGPNGRMYGHMARANPHWQDLAQLHASVQEALVVFAGAHGYVSPRYYGPGAAVPTWNYEAAHVYGVPRLVEDKEELRHSVRMLAEQHEAGAASAWRMENEDPAFIDKMLAAIVSFEIDVTRIEMKAKMSQNKPPATQQAVVGHLQKSSHLQDKILCTAMQNFLAKNSS